MADAVKSGAIKKFFVMAGCDGRMNSREYYTQFAEQLPKDTVILTAGCAKYRYNKLNLGSIGGIPRVLDAGQCNDSYSLAVIALKLKEMFGLDDINDLPIVFNIAWYEQKAVIVLLALLSLGVKNIHLGPTLPAFLSPNVAKVLVEKFGMRASARRRRMSGCSWGTAAGPKTEQQTKPPENRGGFSPRPDAVFWKFLRKAVSIPADPAYNKVSPQCTLHTTDRRKRYVPNSFLLLQTCGNMSARLYFPERKWYLRAMR